MQSYKVRYVYTLFWSTWIRKKFECKRNLAGLVWWEIKNVLHVRVHTWKYAISGLKLVQFDFFGVVAVSSWFQGLVSISGWFDTVTEGVYVRTVQKMQIEAGVQLGMLSILKARGKSCMKLPDWSYSGHTLNRMCVSCRKHTEKDDTSVTCYFYHVLSNEPDFKSQKSWL